MASLRHCFRSVTGSMTRPDSSSNRTGAPLHRSTSPWLLAGLILALSACDDGNLGVVTSDLVDRFGLEPVPAMVFPPDNQPDPDRIHLGRLIFFDPIQSAGFDVACSTCHLPGLGFADGRDLPAGPTGVGLGPDRTLTDPTIPFEARNSPTVINVGFHRKGPEITHDAFVFWDGRITGLENLVTLPQRERSEMRGDGYPVEVTMDTLVARFSSIAEYEELFRAAFPEKAAAVDRGDAETAVDSVSISQALAQFVRSLEGVDSPYDRFVAGDEAALSESQKRGLILFHEKGGCVACHSGPLFSDFAFHRVGALQQGPGFDGLPEEDFGRWSTTRAEDDRYRFRTAPLRNVQLTAPYMHSGGYADLRSVVEFFNRGGGDHPGVARALLEVEPLGLTEQEILDLVGFLESLTDVPDVDIPESVPSGLPVPR